MVQWVGGSVLPGEPIESFFISDVAFNRCEKKVVIHTMLFGMEYMKDVFAV